MGKMRSLKRYERAMDELQAASAHNAEQENHRTNVLNQEARHQRPRRGGAMTDNPETTARQQSDPADRH